MDWIGWISVGGTVVTIAGAGVAWWRANLSRKAKTEAELARDEAVRALAAVEKLAAAVRAISDHLEGPETWLTREGPNRLAIRTRAEHLVITELADKGRGNPFRITETPMVVTPHHPGTLYYQPTYASRGPRTSVQLLVEGRPDPMELPLPPDQPAGGQLR